MVTDRRRRIQVTGNLYFEYEVSPHRAIADRISQLSANRTGTAKSTAPSPTSMVSAQETKAKTGFHIPFKQVRLNGQINPLKPPLHVETVLIGRALGQQTGYLAGVGFRIRDDGYVEGEFEHGAQKFLSFGDFEEAVKNCLERTVENND